MYPRLTINTRSGIYSPVCIAREIGKFLYHVIIGYHLPHMTFLQESDSPVISAIFI